MCKSKETMDPPAPPSLSYLSVVNARILLHSALSALSAKENEMQLAVGCQYHELIESADAIVSMHSTATELRFLLQELPQAAASIVDQTEPSQSEKYSLFPTNPSVFYHLALVWLLRHFCCPVHPTNPATHAQ